MFLEPCLFTHRYTRVSLNVQQAPTFADLFGLLRFTKVGVRAFPALSRPRTQNQISVRECGEKTSTKKATSQKKKIRILISCLCRATL
jgi:hypothetical protein